jgi:hypothetical protein
LTQSPNFYRFNARWLPLILIGVMWLFFFWPMLCGSVVAGYRDSAYLYYPMFQWVDWQMSQGNFPLWMPYENTGFPLLADGTSSLLYPGKAIFLLRWMSFPARYGWYLALHVLLAAAGGYQLAKTLGANRWGATLAGISYGFGGSVLFQVCNVVYLVSAAWLPWALTCVWNMNRARSGTQATLAAAVCCSMMILGGDPQMVYHVGLIAAVTAVAGASNHRESFVGAKSPNYGFRWLPAPATIVCRFGNLILLVVVTSALSAVQLLPTMEWAQYSDRAHSTVAMNIYHGDFDSLVNLPDRPPVSDVYQFSQEPWSMLGLVFPNVFGMDAPVNSRWSAALAGAERIWTPSNYFGCIVFLLAISGFAFTTGAARKHKGQGRAARVWLTWIAVWFCLASFGWYGVNWLMAECGWTVGAQADGTFRQPVGGLYWLMVTLLPKYCLFRYPAKLMVVGCLALCVLAGIRLKPSGLRRLPLLSCVTVATGVVGTAILFLPQTIGFLQSCQTTTLFGPFQLGACWNALMFSMISTIAVCGLTIWGMIICRGRPSGYRGLMLGLIVLLMVELSVNNRWMLHPIDADVMTAKSGVEAEIEKLRPPQDGPPLTVSVLQTDFLNQEFHADSSEKRVAQLATWRREMLFPKTHLLIDDLRLWGGFTSISPAAFDHINPQTVDAAASMLNIEDAVGLKPHPGRASGKGETTKILAPIWRGQTLCLRLPTAPGQPSPHEFQIPLLPMPGWRAKFSSDESDQKSAIPLVPAGPLHSRLAFSDELLLEFDRPQKPDEDDQPIEVRCEYFPASFYWGGLISLLGWLGLILFAGVKLIVNRSFENLQ